MVCLSYFPEMSPVKSKNRISSDGHEAGGLHHHADSDLKSTDPKLTSPESEYTIVSSRSNHKEPAKGAHVLENHKEGSKLSHVDLHNGEQTTIAKSTGKSQHHGM